MKFLSKRIIITFDESLGLGLGLYNKQGFAEALGDAFRRKEKECNFCKVIFFFRPEPFQPLIHFLN
jgi:hypothetical protein